MYYHFLVVFIILVLPIPANCASILFLPNNQADISGVCKVGEKITLNLHALEQLPASSFYRVEAQCPVKPNGSVVSTEMGYPTSDMSFSMPGHYECDIELGIVTKSSCAGVKYRQLEQHKFSLDVHPQ